MSAPDQQPSWLERPGTVKGIVMALYVCCALLLAAEFFIHRHTHFEFEKFFGFYAFYGLGAYVFIVLSAKALRRLIGRPADYYSRDEEPRE